MIIECSHFVALHPQFQHTTLGKYCSSDSWNAAFVRPIFDFMVGNHHYTLVGRLGANFLVAYQVNSSNSSELLYIITQSI